MEIPEELSCSHKFDFESPFYNTMTLPFSLVLIKGQVVCNNNKSSCSNLIQLENTSTNITTEWMVVNNKFKCLADLKTGTNVIVLKCCDAKREISITYEPRKTKFYVTPLYIICKDHDGCYQAPDNYDNSVETACRKIGLAARLIQCLTAVKIYEHIPDWETMKTFQLARDIHSQEKECVPFYSKLSVTEARSMGQEELWKYFANEIMTSDKNYNNQKFLAFLSCTHWDGTTGIVQAHAALGGGGLALFGTGCLYTWASDVKDIVKCFLDPTPIDTKHLMDDSCYRGTYGSCFSTTLGSVCHELGHTFDLGHPKEGIMARGFDNVHLVFVPVKIGVVKTAKLQKEPQCSIVELVHNLNVNCKLSLPQKEGRWSNPSPDRIGSTEIYDDLHLNKKTEDDDNDLTYWSQTCALLLYYHRWFNTEYDYNVPEDLHFDRNRLLLTGGGGLQVVEIRGKGGSVLFGWSTSYQYPRLCHQFLIPRKKIEGAELLVAEDSNGQIIKIPLSNEPSIPQAPTKD